jgi:hypothetical protein
MTLRLGSQRVWLEEAGPMVKSATQSGAQGDFPYTPYPASAVSASRTQ